MDVLIYIVLGVLVLASYLDLKYKAVPSVILTGTIFTVLFLRPENLYFGVLALVFSILIRDLISDVAQMDFGVADIKVFVIIGLLIPNIFNFLMLLGVFVVFQFIYTIIWRTSFKKNDNMPFLPCLLFVYIYLAVVGSVV